MSCRYLLVHNIIGSCKPTNAFPQGSQENENNEGDENGEGNGAAAQGPVALETAREAPNCVEVDDEGAAMENSVLDRIPTRLFHH